MKRIVTFFVLLTVSVICLSAQNAATILDTARNQSDADTISSRSRMVITARNGSTTERVIDQYSKDGPNGSRTVIVFQRPANVAGTRFLTMDNTSGGEDRWIFLPSLGRIRRIAASESSGSFMGTDFSYDDMSTMNRDIALDTHTILREEEFNGVICYVIQSTPRDSSFVYSRTITWVGKNNNLIYKSEMYNQQGALFKVMEMSNFQNIQGRMTPMQTTLSTVGAGTSTTIFMEIIKYDDPIPDSVFTTAFLETGRVR